MSVKKPKISRWKHWNDVFTYLLFVLFATMIWYGHAMHSVRNTRVPVLIQYTGMPGAIGLSDDLPDTVMIEVRDAGSRLNAYHREPLRLTIDMRQYIHGDKGTIRVPSDALRRSISDILQGTSRLIDTHPEEIVCSYFTEQEKTVAAAFSGHLEMADEYQLCSGPKLSRSKIKIYGQDKTLSGIDTIYTQYQDFTGLSDTIVAHIPLNIPKGVRAETDSMDVQIIAERFTEKKFTLPIRVTDVPEGYSIRLFPSEVEVSVRVGMRHFAKVNAGDIKAVCHYEPERIDKLDVEIHYSNPYITAAWSYPVTVEYLLEQ